jgi:hypothetical protein
MLLLVYCDSRRSWPDAATVNLRAAPLEPVMFALTPSAPVCAAVAESACAAQTRGLQQRAGDLAAGGDTAVILGDGLTGQAAAVAVR